MNVVAKLLPACRFSTLVSAVLLRLKAVVFIISVSEPLLPTTEPPDNRSAASTVNVVAKLLPACRISTLVNVVLVRMSWVPAVVRVSKPLLPVTEPLATRSA